MAVTANVTSAPLGKEHMEYRGGVLEEDASEAHAMAVNSSKNYLCSTPYYSNERANVGLVGGRYDLPHTLDTPLFVMSLVAVFKSNHVSNYTLL